MAEDNIPPEEEEARRHARRAAQVKAERVRLRLTRVDPDASLVVSSVTRAKPKNLETRSEPPVDPSAAMKAPAGESSPTAGAVAGGIRILRTQPDELRRHDISDEELDMLIDAKHNSAEAFAWAMLAMATGAAPATLQALCMANVANPKVPLGIVDQIGFFIFVASLALGVAFFVFASSKAKAGASLGEKIRARGVK